MSKRPAEGPLVGGGAAKVPKGTAAASTGAGFAMGTQCLVEGLKKAERHNGKRGTVGALNAATGRYVVLLETGESLALQPANIVVEGESSADAASQPVAAASAAAAAAAPAASTIGSGSGSSSPSGSAGAVGSSRVLQLCNMVTAEELDNPEEYADILSDVRGECASVGGAVASIAIPRLDDLSAQPPALRIAH